MDCLSWMQESGKINISGVGGLLIDIVLTVLIKIYTG
jgi:hypothetical protein